MPKSFALHCAGKAWRIIFGGSEANDLDLLRREGPILLRRSAERATRAGLDARDVGHRRQARLILELHDAAERVGLSSRRSVGPRVGLQKSGNLPLESSDLFDGSVLLSLRCIGLPLEGEYVKHVA